jgi:hypothetical protein
MHASLRTPMYEYHYKLRVLRKSEGEELVPVRLKNMAVKMNLIIYNGLRNFSSCFLHDILLSF